MYVHRTHTRTTQAQAQARTYIHNLPLPAQLAHSQNGKQLRYLFRVRRLQFRCLPLPARSESVLVLLSLFSTPLVDYCRPKEKKKTTTSPTPQQGKDTIRDQFLVSESTRHRSFLARAPATRLQYFPAPPTSPLPNYAQSHFACLAFSRPGSQSAVVFPTSLPISLLPSLTRSHHFSSSPSHPQTS